MTTIGPYPLGSGHAVGGATRKEPDLTGAAARYLELMKQCLTRSLFPEDLAPYVPTTARRRKAFAYVEHLLDRRDLALVRRSPYRAELRAEGRDWPRTAETMVGLRRLDNIQECLEAVLQDEIPGDVLEAGVWRGGAAIFLRAVLAAHGDTVRRVFVADSFEGLPRPDPRHHADTGDMHWSQTFLAVDLETVRANFERYGLLDDQVVFLRGWFKDTLRSAPIQRLSVLRSDADMYGSTIDVLSALYPKVSPGGFVIIDDYGAVPACRAAVDEFRAANSISEPLSNVDWTGVFWRRAQ